MTPFDLKIAPDLKLLCPAFSLSGLKVRESDVALQAEIARFSAELRETVDCNTPTR